ncbi:MAG: nitroreductase family protein, partial [Nanoarchaeota archaeon]|nr:nitroreductase family protein [Nanoarchaeota archaeon]
MDTLEAIKKRRSIRKYKDQPVEWEKIVNVVDAARFAPTSGNIQNWKLVVVKETANKKLISHACYDQKWIESADTIIVVIGQPAVGARFYSGRGEHLYTIQNATAVIENMLIAATDQGLGSCWIGAFDDDLLRRSVMLPEEDLPIGVVTVGYSDEDPDMPPRIEPQHMIFLEKFNAKRK